MDSSKEDFIPLSSNYFLLHHISTPFYFTDSANFRWQAKASSIIIWLLTHSFIRPFKICLPASNKHFLPLQKLIIRKVVFSFIFHPIFHFIGKLFVLKVSSLFKLRFFILFWCSESIFFALSPKNCICSWPYARFVSKDWHIMTISFPHSQLFPIKWCPRSKPKLLLIIISVPLLVGI